MNLFPENMIHIAYSEDRDLCTYPKGYRFEHIRVLADDEGKWWIHGVGYLGCHTWVKLSVTQKRYIQGKLGTDE